MDTPEIPKNPALPEKNIPSSFLDEIIQTSHISDAGALGSTGENNPTDPNGSMVVGTNSTPIVRKTRDPMTTAMMLKFIGSLLIITVIFFGSFLAYIVFNPDQAAFFVNIFGINPNDIQTLLKNLINGSFGITVLIFSIVWIISLFRAIWTPRDQKRRRLMGWLTATTIGILLFSILAFWAYLFNIINATDYANPGGEVSIYDNDLYTHDESKELSRLATTDTLIGPITLRYDLSTNAREIAKKNLISIESYRIDFDGAKCINGESSITGSNPLTEQGLICTFDETRTYNIQGSYTGKDRLGEVHAITIPLNTVKIAGLIEINTNINKNGKNTTTVNASKLKKLGNPKWLYETGETKTQSSITETMSNNPIIVCLIITSTACDRYFMIVSTNTTSVEGSILFNQDSTNSLGVNMTLTGISINDNEIVSIDWISNDGARMCQGISEKCTYNFTSYGTKTITATIQLANSQSYKVQGILVLNEPLIIAKHGEIQDQDNKLLNTTDTFDPALGAYVIRDIVLPATVTLNAQNVVTENLGYSLRGIVWKISNGKTTTELIGDKVTYNIPRTERYTIEAIYTFQKNIITSKSDIRTAKDRFIIDLDRKSLEPVFKIQPSSDYAPSQVTVDASLSRSKNSEIKKIIFDFGEGKPQTEGDAIQTYEYKTAGEKQITLTIIDANNERATKTSTIVLKDTPKTIGFTTTMSPGYINMPVDFMAEGNSSNIEEWIWNFDDNTLPSRGSETTHTFTKTGTYLVTLMVRYDNGTIQSTKQSFQVDTATE